MQKARMSPRQTRPNQVSSPVPGKSSNFRKLNLPVIKTGGETTREKRREKRKKKVLKRTSCSLNPYHPPDSSNISFAGTSTGCPQLNFQTDSRGKEREGGGKL